MQSLSGIQLADSDELRINCECLVREVGLLEQTENGKERRLLLV